MQETYTIIDSQTILVTQTTPITDSDGNAIQDANGNPVNNVVQFIKTLTQAQADLASDSSNLAGNLEMASAVQAKIDANNATIDLDNARIAAFSQPIPPTWTIQIKKEL